MPPRPCQPSTPERDKAVARGVEQRFHRAAQRRRLPSVNDRVREGAARAEASDGAALPTVVGPTEEAAVPEGVIGCLAVLEQLPRVTLRVEARPAH